MAIYHTVQKQIEAFRFDGKNLLKGMDWDMGGAFVKNKNGFTQYVLPGHYIIKEDDAGHFYVKDGEDFLKEFELLTTNNTSMKDVTSNQKELTFGEKSVGIQFNPGGNEEVEKIKRFYADTIDYLNDLRNNTDNGEKKRLLSLAITESQSAQMFAVKAVTWQY